MRAIQKKLTESKSCPKYFSSKCSIFFTLDSQNPLSRLEMRAIQKKLSAAKSYSKSFASKCSFYFKLILWPRYLTQTHEIFTQKIGAQVLLESFFRIFLHFLKQNSIVFLYLIWHETPCILQNLMSSEVFSLSNFVRFESANGV